MIPESKINFRFYNLGSAGCQGRSFPFGVYAADGVCYTVAEIFPPGPGRDFCMLPSGRMDRR
jgi:hypothetical protein